MEIVYKESFAVRLERQIRYIKSDNPIAAKKFRKQLITRIKEIPKNPLSYRKSIYFDDDSIRDLIYKGYIVVFKIGSERIEVFGFVKFQQNPTD